MSTPTSDQLAPNIDPLLRDYIEARVAEMIVAARIRHNTAAATLEQTQAAVQQQLDRMVQLERMVRSHLGIYIPE
jgi:hypothetical protein